MTAHNNNILIIVYNNDNNADILVSVYITMMC